MWQPIETAPLAENEWTDNPVVLVWVADGRLGNKGPEGVCAFGYCYRNSDGEVRAKASGYMGDWKITHWMPLPAPPSDEPMTAEKFDDLNKRST